MICGQDDRALKDPSWTLQTTATMVWVGTMAATVTSTAMTMTDTRKEGMIVTSRMMVYGMPDRNPRLLGRGGLPLTEPMPPPRHHRPHCRRQDHRQEFHPLVHLSLQFSLLLSLPQY